MYNMLYIYVWLNRIFFFFLQPHLQHREVPNLGVKWELQLPARSTAMATLDPSYLCDLHHSMQPRWILNTLSKARDRTCILTDNSSGS